MPKIEIIPKVNEKMKNYQDSGENLDDLRFLVNF